MSEGIVTGLVIAAGGVVLGGLMTWISYVSKQLRLHGENQRETAVVLERTVKIVDDHDRILRPIRPVLD